MTYGVSSSSATRCRRCRKPIVWPGLCYTCATGLPRMLRPRDTDGLEAAAHQVEPSDQPATHHRGGLEA
jgi:hypothetical protein